MVRLMGGGFYAFDMLLTRSYNGIFVKRRAIIIRSVRVFRVAIQFWITPGIIDGRIRIVEIGSHLFNMLSGVY